MSANWTHIGLLAGGYVVTVVLLACVPIDDIGAIRRLSDADRYLDDPLLVPPVRPKIMWSQKWFWFFVVTFALLASLLVVASLAPQDRQKHDHHKSSSALWNGQRRAAFVQRL